MKHAIVMQTLFLLHRQHDLGTNLHDSIAQETQSHDRQQQRQTLANIHRLLNREQLLAYNEITNAIYSNHAADPPYSKLFFVNGAGGTGKSTLFKALLARVRSDENSVALAVATSGIASLLLPGGRTAHSLFKIPIRVEPGMQCQVNLRSNLADLIMTAKLIVWDEAVMCSRFVFEAVNQQLQMIMAKANPILKNVPFGGKVIVFGGDFRQLLPVVPNSSKEQVMDQCIQHATFWHHTRVLHLLRNMRLEHRDHESREFADLLLKVGAGIPPYQHSIPIKRQWLLDAAYPWQLINFIYPSLRDSAADHTQFRDRAILAAKNDDVNRINDLAFSVFPGEERVYTSLSELHGDSATNEITSQFTTESLQELHIKGVPDHVLKLKTGMPLIITRNIDKAAKLCNGTKVYVTRLLHYQIGVKRFVDDDDDEATEYILPRINFLTDGEGTLPFQMLRRQLPVKPAWCITIHKAQGQSLQAAGLYIKHPESIFTHGQLYVALSRTRNPRNLRIAVPLSSIETQRRRQLEGSIPVEVENVVYHDILQ